jgi:hypothetical protein
VTVVKAMNDNLPFPLDSTSVELIQQRGTLSWWRTQFRRRDPRWGTTNRHARFADATVIQTVQIDSALVAVGRCCAGPAAMHGSVTDLLDPPCRRRGRESHRDARAETILADPRLVAAAERTLSG